MSDHAAVAAAARAQRGTWMLAGLYPSSMTAKGVAQQIQRGSDKYRAYLPGGDFEAYAARAGEDEAVWIRYVAGDVPVEPLPDRMTVRVRHDGDGSGYEGAGVITVTISTLCPNCGGPRGWDAVTPHRFHHDGAYLVVDRWSNPCGHADVYEAVVKESRERRFLPPTDGTPALQPHDRTGPVAVVLAAARERRAMHAKQAAQVLEDHGYGNAAVLVRTELTKRRGHMSARQAATFLTAVASPAVSVRTITNTRDHA
ncbi:hypothetical protein [Streptomyces sp. NPDC086835]|uniref:hypothetical protein n=1 Tax=Streptomyces sp. NPDC086835 TaxID=3365761 RepID=UPI00382E60FC